jgi:UDP-3-O-[3-hydroxymyristoyl] glucosamine N-acyltransferase
MKLSDLLNRLGIAAPDALASRDCELASVASLADAGPHQLAFCRDAKNARGLADTGAAAVLVTAALVATPSPALLVPCDAPDHAFAIATDLLMPEPPTPPPGVHASAVVDPTATIDPTAYVGPGCVIGARTTVGARARLDANVSLEEEVTVGVGARLWPGVAVLYRCSIGKRVMIGANFKTQIE